MNTSRLHIVALPYYEAGECLGEFLAEANGRAMTLRPEPTNEYDPQAIRAYDWQGRHIGYVASHDILEAWQVFRGSGRHSLRGKICEVNEEHKCIVFECQVGTIGDVPDLYPNAPFLEWSYSGPVLRPTQEMLTLEYMMDEINERLDEYTAWTSETREDFMKLASRFCEVAKYDLSGDMADYRRCLCLRMQALDNREFLPLIEELKMTFGRAGRESQGGDVLNYWMQVLSDAKVIKALVMNRHKYDVDKVCEELTKFPEAMYDEWLENREHFVAKLLYMHIPREVLWQLVSGIAFMELTTAEKIPLNPVQKEMEEKTPHQGDVNINVNIGQSGDVVAEGGRKTVNNR